MDIIWEVDNEKYYVGIHMRSIYIHIHVGIRQYKYIGIGSSIKYDIHYLSMSISQSIVVDIYK